MLEALDTVTVPERSSTGALRIPVLDAYKLGGIGIVSVGRIESGTLKPGMNVTFAPSGASAEVKVMIRVGDGDGA